MNTNTILQVPINKKLRDAATASAKLQGFSSLQEAIRIFVTGIAEGTHRVTFEPKPVQLSARAVRRYDKMTKDILAGKNMSKGFTNVDEMMKYLNS